jgi:hypothetical protein
MRCIGLRLTIRRLYRRLRRTAGNTATTVRDAWTQTVTLLTQALREVREQSLRLLSSATNLFKTIYDGLKTVVLTIWRLFRMAGRYLIAFISRRWLGIVLVIAVGFIGAEAWTHWPPIPKPVHRHMIHRPPAADVLHRISPLDKAHDSRNGDYYYIVNILFVPLQTVLLLLGGLAAYHTLRQSHHFKQHDVEANCVRDYLEIERQLIEANDDKKLARAIRSYWVLMLYEYYWWRKDLISRELFANWCEFRIQRFRKNEKYSFSSPNQNLENYVKGYEYHRKEKTFPSPSRFDDLMTYLMNQATNQRENLNWNDIERFRYSLKKPI